MGVEPRPCPCCSLVVASRRRAGCTSSARRCPGRGSARRCRSTSSRGTRRRRSSGSSPSGRAAGAAARPARPLGAARAADRPRSLLALGVGLWAYLTTASRSRSCARSRCATRSTPRRGCGPSTCRRRSSALGGALLATAHGRVARAPLVLAGVVAAGALLDLVHAILPAHDVGLAPLAAPDAVGPLAHAPRLAAALALLVAARGLARRRRRAWQLASSLAALSRAPRTARLHHGALASVVVLVLLVARRHDFDRPGDPATRAPALHARSLVASVRSAATRRALWLNRLAADRPFTLPFAARETLDGLFALHVPARRTSPARSASGSRSRCSCSASSRPPGSSPAGSRRGGTASPAGARARARARARAGVGRRHARAVRAARGQVVLLHRDERAFLAYRVVGGVAIVSGDPIGPPRAPADAAPARFVAYAHARDWRIADPRRVRARGCRSTARTGCTRSTTATRRSSTRRRSRSTAGRSARCASRCTGSRAPAIARRAAPERDRRPSCATSSRRSRAAWRGAEPERGFVMALDALFALGDEDALFVDRVRPRRAAGGIPPLRRLAGAAALSLSSMPRLRTTPNGFNEWLICEASRGRARKASSASR